MGKGQIIKNSFLEFTDSYTGKKITRLTTTDSKSSSLFLL